VALLGWRWWAGGRAPQYGIVIDSTIPAEDFTLPSSLGRPVALSEFRGEPVLIYFGYTTCPDVCPTTLADLRMAMQELGDDADKVQVLFVSVDPERDTAERLQAYLQYFDPRFIGLTGQPAEIEAIASRFGVYFAKNETNSAADYLVDHTSAVLLLDADGKLRLMFPYGTTGKQLAADTKLFLR
jgi:protein SCO1/2